MCYGSRMQSADLKLRGLSYAVGSRRYEVPGCSPATSVALHVTCKEANAPGRNDGGREESPYGACRPEREQLQLQTCQGQRGAHRGRGSRVGGRRRRGSATRVDHVRQLGATAVAGAADGRLRARGRGRRVGGRGCGVRRRGLVVPATARLRRAQDPSSRSVVAKCSATTCRAASAV